MADEISDARQALRDYAREGVTIDGRNLKPNALNEGIQYVARHDPARVLAEVDAKRKILDRIVPLLEELDQAELKRVREYHGHSSKLLRLLALPYAKHLDYRESWRP